MCIGAIKILDERLQWLLKRAYECEHENTAFMVPQRGWSLWTGSIRARLPSWADIIGGDHAPEVHEPACSLLAEGTCSTHPPALQHKVYT